MSGKSDFHTIHEKKFRVKKTGASSKLSNRLFLLSFRIVYSANASAALEVGNFRSTFLNSP